MGKKIAITAFKIVLGAVLGLLLSHYWVDIKALIVSIFS